MQDIVNSGGDRPHVVGRAERCIDQGFNSMLGYDSVVTILKQNAPDIAEIENSFETLKIFPLTAELASYTAKIRSNITDRSGTKIVSSLLETGLVIKREEGWKLLQGQTSVLMNEK